MEQFFFSFFSFGRLMFCCIYTVLQYVMLAKSVRDSGVYRPNNINVDTLLGFSWLLHLMFLDLLAKTEKTYVLFRSCKMKSKVLYGIYRREMYTTVCLL